MAAPTLWRPHSEVLTLWFQHRCDLPIRPLDAAAIETQQRSADLFFANRLIPRAVQVREIVYPQ